MRSFFLQLFLSFWIASIGIFIGAVVFFPNQDPGTYDNLRSSLSRSSQRVAEYALAGYRARGCESLAAIAPEYILADLTGNALCNASLTPLQHDVLRSAVNSGRTSGHLADPVWVQVHPVALADGERFFLMQTSVAAPRRYWPLLPKSALPVSILVTFLFAYFLTRPVRALSAALRSFTSGDLSIRLPVSRKTRFGLSTDGVRTLMLDFNSMADRVTELMEAQKLLVRDISHELRSPLARLRLALELAREEAPSARAEFDRMEREAEKVNSLIGEILTLSLLESTRQPVHKELFSVDQLLIELLPDIRFEASARGCEVRLDQECLDGCWLLGQKEMLRRALENVLRNAVRYAKPGGMIEIEVHKQGQTEADESLGDQPLVVVSISDRGPGIPEKNLPHIFRPFYRVDVAREASTGGFGVGLAIAERAVLLNGGTIRAMNREGGGLRVEMLLPRANHGDGKL